jgi:hypothetical protein
VDSATSDGEGHGRESGAPGRITHITRCNTSKSKVVYQGEVVYHYIIICLF